MGKRLQCHSPTGWDYFLDASGIIAIEPSLWPSDLCYVTMNRPRSEPSRILVCEPAATIEARYYALAPVCELAARHT